MAKSSSGNGSIEGKVGNRVSGNSGNANLASIFRFTYPNNHHPNWDDLWEEKWGNENHALSRIIDNSPYQSFSPPVDGQIGESFLLRPYFTFIFVTAKQQSVSLDNKQEIENRFMVTFGDVTERRPSINFLTSDADEVKGVTVYFGDGIYWPEPGAEPIGKLEFGAGPNCNKWEEPLFQEAGHSKRPGLYAGRMNLLAGFNSELTPAILSFEPFDGQVSDNSLDPESHLFYVSAPKTPASNDTRDAIRLQVFSTKDWVQGSGGLTEHGGGNFRNEDEGDTEATAPKIARAKLGSTEIVARFTPDTRPNKLRSNRPQGPSLALMGILIPDNIAAPGIKKAVRSWVDLDYFGQPVNRPLQTKWQSLVVKSRPFRSRSESYLYDWSAKEGTPAKKQDKFGRSHSTFLAEKNHCNYQLSRLVIGKNRYENLHKNDGQPFGFVELSAAWPENDKDVSLPWLDAAGTVELGDKTTQPLGRWHAHGASLRMSYDANAKTVHIKNLSNSEERPYIFKVEKSGRKLKFGKPVDELTVVPKEVFVIAGHVFRLEFGS